MAYFLFKTEPSSYSFADLKRERRAMWDGISNPLALRNLATLRKGDSVVIYHTGDEKQAVGLAIATSDPYPDPKLKDPKRLVVEIEAKQPLPRAVTLTQVKADPVLKNNDLARLPRLSVIPFTESQIQRLLKLAGV